MNSQSGLANEHQALLAQLNDIVAPDPVGLWPLAPGWWLLIALVVAAIVAVAAKIWLHHRANGYRRQALRELHRLPATHTPEYIQQLARLLKRTALSAYPQARHQLASLHGTAWLTFLNSTCKRPPFGGEAAELLVQGLYRPQHNPVDVDAVTEQVRTWIKNHRRNAAFQADALRAARGGPAHV